jgi:two-component system sensor histidine kinase KdpD
MPSAVYHFRPLISSGGAVGVLGVVPDDAEDVLPSATVSALQSFADQAAIAIERTWLVEQATKAATAAESERLRGALLSSISHDLRTPLASILGSATSLRQLGDRMTSRDRADLLATIEEEASRYPARLGGCRRCGAGRRRAVGQECSQSTDASLARCESSAGSRGCGASGTGFVQSARQCAQI